MSRKDPVGEAQKHFEEGRTEQAATLLREIRTRADIEGDEVVLADVASVVRQMRAHLRGASLDAFDAALHDQPDDVDRAEATAPVATPSSPARWHAPREGVREDVRLREPAPSTMKTSERAGPAAPRLPWPYAWASTVAAVAIVAAAFCVIGGVITGIEASKYTAVGADEFGLQAAQTRHRGDVIVLFSAIGVLTAALWMAIAVGVKLMADIGTSLRGTSGSPRADA
jgi:hypothetical protein